MYCNTLVCIAEKKVVGLYCKMGVLTWNCIAIPFIVLQEKAGKAGVVSQYTEVYCDCGAKARLDCIAIQCPAMPRYGQEARRQQALGRTGLVGRSAGTGGALGRAGGALGSAGGRGAQALGHKRGRVGARGAQRTRRRASAAAACRARPARAAGRGRRAAWASGVLLG